MKNKVISKASSGKREDIIQRAYEIFYQHGMHATGINTMLEGSGISKRTLYKHFRSKEELIAAAVSHYQSLLFAQIPELITAHSADPKQQILHLFDLKYDEFNQGNFRGCFAINAKLEFESKDSAIENGCSSFYKLFEQYIASLCVQAGCKKPDALARKIMILFEGAIVLGQMHHDPSTAQTAKEMVAVLLG